MKKQSAPKPTTRPRSRLVFFVDRSLGSRKLSAALRALNLHVEVHDDHFGPEEDDVKWLAICGERRWVVVTKDLAIRRDPAEIAAMEKARVHAILRLLESAASPIHLIVKAGGRVEVIDSSAED